MVIAVEFAHTLAPLHRLTLLSVTRPVIEPSDSPAVLAASEADAVSVAALDQPKPRTTANPMHVRTRMVRRD